MHLSNRGLLDPLLDTVDNVVDPVVDVVSKVGGGVKTVAGNLLRPNVAPTPTAKPTHAPTPTHTQPSQPTKPSNPGTGSGNPGNGSGSDQSSGNSGNNNGNGNSPSAGNPTQTPPDGKPAPTQQPSDGSPPDIINTPPPGNSQSADPIRNVGSGPSSAGQDVGGSKGTAHDISDSQSFTSFTTSGSFVFGISGTSTIPITHQTVPTNPIDGANGGDNNNSTSGPTNAVGTKHKGVSSVAIGLITAAVVLIGIFVAVFVIRRVHQRRRAERRTRWAPVMAQGTPDAPSRSSVRSSFATTFDYGLRATSPLQTSEAPALPPLSHISEESKRSSNGSNHSQWLMVDRPNGQDQDLLGASGNEPLTPLSVAPFTPTESFKFPQPPKSSQEPDEESPFAHYDTSPVTPSAPPLTRTQTEQTEQSIYSRPSFNDKPVLKSGVSITVRRPFAPSLPDELYVAPGQLVTIEQMFDDGWNLVRALDGARGLVPLACFEESDHLSGAAENNKRRSSLIEYTATTN